MYSLFDKSKHSLNIQKGFTLIEVMIVVVIIALLAAIALPSYNDYVIRTKRTDMMTDMQRIAADIDAQKIIHGTYKSIDITDIVSSTSYKYPADNAVYNVRLDLDTSNNASSVLSSNWKLTATPIAGSIMEDDGNVTLDANGEKCHIITSTNKKCTNGSGWQIN